MAALCEPEDWREDPTYNDEPLADGDLFAESPGRTYVRFSTGTLDVRFVPPGQEGQCPRCDGWKRLSDGLGGSYPCPKCGEAA